MKNGISYPIETPPEPGELIELADGVMWLRQPLPFSLNHINCYLLRDNGGWTVLDTGLRNSDVKKLWQSIIDNRLSGEPIRRVIATHLHPDHVGLAGWFTSRFGVELWMARSEFFLLRMLAADGPQDIRADAVAFYKRIGFSEERLDNYRMRFGSFGALIHPLPAGHRRLRDRQMVEIDGRDWEVVVGRGHSPEHACLYSRDLKIMLAGDQVLPRITPNVSVHPTEPHADPLGEWLESCATLPDRIADDVLVLPAHGLPFNGLHARLAYLVEHHREALVRVRAACGEAATVPDVFPALFDREIDDSQFFMAAGECLAHINYLEARGYLRGEVDGEGLARYQSTGAEFKPAGGGGV